MSQAAVSASPRWRLLDLIENLGRLSNNPKSIERVKAKTAFPFAAGAGEIIIWVGGRWGDRTPGLRIANAALSQLS